MLSLKELSQQIDSYREKRIDVAAFENWFRNASWGSYDRSGDAISDAIAAVRQALSELEFEEIDEAVLREELVAAVHPSAGQRVLVYGRPLGEFGVLRKPLFLLASALL